MDYCISDIHGYYGLFCRLLDKIRFSDKDKLYVLGDIIDKGPDSIRLAKLLFSMPNVYCIAGNHEYDFLKYYRALMKQTEDYDWVLEKIAVMPREFAFGTKRAGTLLKHYAMIGVARVEDGCPLYAEACNEKGLCMAGLNFPANAVYKYRGEKGQTELAPYELIPYVLGKCASVDEAEKLLSDVEVVGERFRPHLPLAPLHWIISDDKRNIVFECTSEGARIFDDPFGVLTNNPPFPYHAENVKNYEHLSPDNKNFTVRVGKADFSEGEGGVGLPGDLTSKSRFVKAWFCLKNSVCGDSTESKVAHVLAMLGTVAMTGGAVVTAEGRADVTRYSCCIDAANAIYYYRTYDKLKVGKIALGQADVDGGELGVYVF